VYELPEQAAATRFATASRLTPDQKPASISFFAPDGPGDGTVPVYEQQTREGGSSLLVGEPDGTEERQARPLFYALPADTAEPPATTAPLYEFVHEAGVERTYSTDADLRQPGYRRTGTPFCLVWKNPVGIMIPRS
jgi:hypothetical protein